jgi:hypothetical protein
MSDIKTFKLLAEMLPPSQSILLRGPTGIGKSAIVRQFAEATGKPMVDVRTAVMQEGDFNGIPNIERIRETGIASNAMYGWFVRACREPVVLFLDEFPRAMMPVLQGTLQLVLDRCLSNDEHGNPYELHPETRVIAAGNFGAEYEGEDLDPAMLRRFLVIDLDPGAEEWLEWAKGEVDPVICEFIKEHPGLLRGDPTVAPGEVCPNPAVWAQLSTNMVYANIAPDSWAGGRRPPGAWAMALGMVGPAAAGRLMDYIERYERLLTAKGVLNGVPDAETIIAMVAELDTADSIDLSEKIIEHLKVNGLKRSQLDNLVEYCKVINAEIFMNFWATMQGDAAENPKSMKVIKVLRPQVSQRVIECAKATVKTQAKIAHERNQSSKP